MVAVEQWYHDNDLSTHMLTLQQALPSPQASGDAASTAGRSRWLMGICQSNLHSAESCSLPNWQQLPPDSLNAMAYAATTWHAAASTEHKSMPLDNHSETIQMLHTRTRKGAHETLQFCYKVGLLTRSLLGSLGNAHDMLYRSAFMRMHS
jgi:hypothetical protein